MILDTNTSIIYYIYKICSSKEKTAVDYSSQLTNEWNQTNTQNYTYKIGTMSKETTSNIFLRAYLLLITRKHLIYEKPTLCIQSTQRPIIKAKMALLRNKT